jgi:voltage-gated potassium channel
VTTFYERLYELKENRVIESLSKNDSFVIICGYGQMTKMLLRKDSFDNKYVIIEKSLEVAKQAIKDGYNTIVDDASRHDVLDKFNHTYSKISLICLGNNDIENIYITLNAKSISSDIRVVARASSISMEKKFKIAGADHVIIPNLAANTMLLTAINNPVMYGVMHSFLSGKNAAYLDEIRVVGYDNLVGKKIEAIGLKEHKLLLIGLKRGSDFVFNPSKEIELQSDDILLVMGLKISIEYFHKIVQASL